MHSDELPFTEDCDSLLPGGRGMSLPRIDAPPDFAAGVLRRLASEQAQAQRQADQQYRFAEPPRQRARSVQKGARRELQRVRSLSNWDARAVSGLAAAVLLILLLPVAAYMHERELQAQAAAQQFTLAMRLTHAALLDAGRHIAEHSHPPNGD